MKDDNNDDAIILKINDINDGNYVDIYDEDCDDANYDDAVRCHSAAYRECSSYEHYGPTVVAELSEWIVGELNGSKSYSTWLKKYSIIIMKLCWSLYW